MTDNKHVWTRNTEKLVVEVLVGAVWVAHSSHDVLSAAQASADKALGTPGVLATRIMSLASRVVCAQVGDTTHRPAVLAPSKGYEDTGDRTSCRACSAPAQRVVLGAGSVRWVFCTACGKVYPHG